MKNKTIDEVSVTCMMYQEYIVLYSRGFQNVHGCDRVSACNQYLKNLKF